MAPSPCKSLIGTTVDIDGRTLRFEALLGAGSFGSVLLATDVQTTEQFAVKVIDPTEPSNESRLHSLVSPHRNILTYHSTQSTPFHTFLLLDYIHTGTLWDLLNPASPRASPFAPTSSSSSAGNLLSDELITSLLLDVLSGIQHCHSLGIAHCDIKPDNILLFYPPGESAPEAKLADFGLATMEQTSLAFERGTEGFMSPECELKKNPWDFPGKDVRYEPRKVDVWAVGVVLFMMITGGKKPWSSTLSKKDADFQHYLADPRAYLLWKHPSLTDTALDVLLEMLDPEPAHRPESLVHLAERVKAVGAWTRAQPVVVIPVEGQKVIGWEWVPVRKVAGGRLELIRGPIWANGKEESPMRDPLYPDVPMIYCDTSSSSSPLLHRGSPTSSLSSWTSSSDGSSDSSASSSKHGLSSPLKTPTSVKVMNPLASRRETAKATEDDDSDWDSGSDDGDEEYHVGPRVMRTLSMR